jgi:tRNA modification GTPase
VDLGRHLTRPWRVVVAGAPNVGKSSLINALAGFTRTVVTAVPGTTRDVVATAAAIDGWPVELIDTAGLRLTGD